MVRALGREGQQAQAAAGEEQGCSERSSGITNLGLQLAGLRPTATFRVGEKAENPRRPGKLAP